MGGMRRLKKRGLRKGGLVDREVGLRVPLCRERQSFL